MTLTPVGNTELFLKVEGSGTPILMLHGGLGLDHTYLPPYFNTLSDTYQVIYYDHRGNGRSQQPDDYSTLNFDVLCDDADNLRQHLGLDKIIVIGHSYGGFIAQKYAIKYGQHLKGLVLIDTVPAFDYQPQPSGTPEQLEAFGAAFSRPMADNDDWRTTWTTLSQMYFHEYQESVGNALDETTTYVAAAWNQGSALLGEYNTLDGLPNITAPTLVVSGRHDFVTPPDSGTNRIASLVPNATAHIFENSAHYPFIEEQDAFFTVLHEWLSSLE